MCVVYNLFSYSSYTASSLSEFSTNNSRTCIRQISFDGISNVTGSFNVFHSREKTESQDFDIHIPKVTKDFQMRAARQDKWLPVLLLRRYGISRGFNQLSGFSSNRVALENW